jgi:hypothetical protein
MRPGSAANSSSEAETDSPQTRHKPTRAKPDNRGFLRVSADCQFVANFEI